MPYKRILAKFFAERIVEMARENLRKRAELIEKGICSE